MNEEEALNLIDLLHKGSITEEQFLFNYCTTMGKEFETSKLFIIWCYLNNYIQYFVELALINLTNQFNIIIITKDGKYHSSYINKHYGKEIHKI